jgi:hypothetical protein
MHDRQLSRVIELEPWDPLSVGQDGWLGQLPQLAAVAKGLEDVLLDVVVVIDDPGHPFAERLSHSSCRLRVRC